MKNRYTYSKQNHCIICNVLITDKTKRCHSCAKIGERNHNWRGGISFEPYPLGWNKTFKEQIRYRDKYKCQLCGVSEVECNRRLEVHRIDYNKKNLNTENLISLCKSCHMRTNFNRDYYYTYCSYITENKIYV